MVTKGEFNPMPRAVVILPSTTYRAADFIKAAESLGVDLVVVSEQPPPFDMGDRYLQIDCSDTEGAAAKITQLGDDVPLDGVVAADDSGVVIAATVGTSLGLAANDPDAALATRDKAEMRRRFDSSEVPQPRFEILHRDDDPHAAAERVGYPVVVKPVSRSASQGVLRANNWTELTGAISRIERIVGLDRTEPLLLEEYMPGTEVAVEGLIRDGGLTVLSIFDKPDTPTGPVFPETILVTPSRLPEKTLVECVRVAELAIQGLGLNHGPVHIELKAGEDQVRVLEVAARSIGGLCSRSLSFGLMDTSLETLILRNAMQMDKPELRREPHASGVLMIPIQKDGILAEVRGIEETRAIEGVTGIDLTIPAGTAVLPPPEGDRYLGFVFARGADPGGVEAALRKAAETVQPVIE
jgi:biotin carboxylase